MMVETSPTTTSSTPREIMGNEEPEIQEESNPSETATKESETEDPPKPRKTWALPKSPPPDSKGQQKKTLMDIMAEEEEQTSKAKRIQEEQERENKLLQEEEAALMKAMQASLATTTTTTASDTKAAAAEDDMDEDLKLAMMLSMQEQSGAAVASAGVEEFSALSSQTVPPAAAAAAGGGFTNDTEENALSQDEMKEIEKALQEADATEHAKSLQLALQLQEQEDAGGKMPNNPQKRRAPQGNVRTMNRQEFLREQGKGDDDSIDYYDDDVYDDFDDLDDNGMTEAGFRINSSKPSAWLSTDRATIIGPNQELRTKHDLKLQGQANAYRLEVRANDETGERAHVGNKAYNAFHRSMQKKTVKGVAAHGHGRATADTDKTRDGALDGRVRLQIARAVNNGLIEDFHGCVKEGKEALVFHADKGKESEGFDVAVKVFKRITEFKNRGDYVAGDPRYGDGKNFRNSKARQQVEQWAEKEHRNLVRAYRAEVPVPRPLWTKENVLFLRFLGEEGWPSPQLRELDIKKGSKKWTALYEQTMSAMQKLFVKGRLVHGDLSEYNILVCPAKFLKRFDGDLFNFDGGDQNVEDGKSEDCKVSAIDGGGEDQKIAAEDDEQDQKMPAKAVSFGENTEQSTTNGTLDTTAASPEDEELQVALIDFGQAVDQRHPEAEALLQRDVLRVKQFFDKMGITTIGVEAAMAYVQTEDAPLFAQ